MKGPVLDEQIYLRKEKKGKEKRNGSVNYSGIWSIPTFLEQNINLSIERQTPLSYILAEMFYEKLNPIFVYCDNRLSELIENFLFLESFIQVFQDQKSYFAEC